MGKGHCLSDPTQDTSVRGLSTTLTVSPKGHHPARRTGPPTSPCARGPWKAETQAEAG